MLRFCCCCCGDRDDSEREPLLHPGPGACASARSTRSGNLDAHSVSGKLVMRRVGVEELDKSFTDIAQMFNKQLEHYENMVQSIRNVRQIYGCNRDDTLTLTECVKLIREEHADYTVLVTVKVYDFSLSVVPLGSAGEPPPPHLKLAQDEFKEASDSAKAIMSKNATIQQSVDWVLHNTDQMAERVKEAEPTYLEQRRLRENLERNVKEVRRANNLSQRYRQRATEVLTEVAQIAGTVP